MATTQSRKRVVLGLDLDGVLHPVSAEIGGTPQQADALRLQVLCGKISPFRLGLLCRRRQRLLADVLARHPYVDIVISSSWRNWATLHKVAPDDAAALVLHLRYIDTLEWLTRYLLPELSCRVIGATPWRGCRVREMRAFVAALNPQHYARGWVALDDQGALFPADRLAPFYREPGAGPASGIGDDAPETVVLVDGHHGLDLASAQALDRALTRCAVSCAMQGGQA